MKFIRSSSVKINGCYFFAESIFVFNKTFNFGGGTAINEILNIGQGICHTLKKLWDVVNFTKFHFFNWSYNSFYIIFPLYLFMIFSTKWNGMKFLTLIFFLLRLIINWGNCLNKLQTLFLYKNWKVQICDL